MNGNIMLARLFIITSSYAVVIIPGHFTVRWLLSRYALDDAGGGLKRAGATIGVLERILTLTLVLIGQYAAIALVLTAKSVTRFEALKDRSFAEYYLIGTFSSMLFAILVGIYWAWILGKL